MAIDFQTIFIVLGVIFVSMTIHEVMHGLVAYYLGDDTAKAQGRLTLNPLKHIDPFLTILLPILLALTPGAPIFGGAKPVPFNPQRLRYGDWGVALVAIAGPLVNLVIAFVVYGIMILVHPPEISLFGEIINLAIVVNLGFFVFNMLPLPPLDGSRVLYALAPEFVRKAMETIERFGIWVILIIVLFAQQYIGAFMLGSISGLLGLFELIFGV